MPNCLLHQLLLFLSIIPWMKALEMWTKKMDCVVDRNQDTLSRFVSDAFKSSSLKCSSFLSLILGLLSFCQSDQLASLFFIAAFCFFSTLNLYLFYNHNIYRRKIFRANCNGFYRHAIAGGFEKYSVKSTVVNGSICIASAQSIRDSAI